LQPNALAYSARLEVALPKRFISVAEGDIVALRHPEFVQGKKFKLNSLWSN